MIHFKLKKKYLKKVIKLVVVNVTKEHVIYVLETFPFLVQIN